MRAVKSTADLKALALKHGASVNVGGKVFNASAQRLAMVPAQRETAPVAAAAVEKATGQTTVTVDMAPIAAAMAVSSEANAQALREFGQALAREQLVAAPTVWNFKVTYDQAGRITNIKATANN